MTPSGRANVALHRASVVEAALGALQAPPVETHRPLRVNRTSPRIRGGLEHVVPLAGSEDHDRHRVAAGLGQPLNGHPSASESTMDAASWGGEVVPQRERSPAQRVGQRPPLDRKLVEAGERGLRPARHGRVPQCQPPQLGDDLEGATSSGRAALQRRESSRARRWPQTEVSASTTAALSTSITGCAARAFRARCVSSGTLRICGSEDIDTEQLTCNGFVFGRNHPLVDGEWDIEPTRFA